MMSRRICWAAVVAILVFCDLAYTFELPSVRRTLGDTRQVRCLVPTGNALWAGTLGAGMVRYTRDERRGFDASAGLPGNRVNDCAWAGGALWVATDAGVAVFDGESERFETLESGRFLRVTASPDGVVAAREDGWLIGLGNRSEALRRLEITPTTLAVGPDGRMAAGDFSGRVVTNESDTGVRLEGPVIGLEVLEDGIEARTPGRTFQLYLDPADGYIAREAAQSAAASPPPGSHVFATAEWHGRTLAATDAGLFENTAGTWRVAPAAGPPCGDRLSALAVFDGALWVGGFDEGLCRFSDGHWQKFSGTAYLPSDMINDMDADDEHLYVATLKGLVTVDRAGRFQTYTVEQCQPDPYRNCPWYASVTGVSVDRQTGAVWVSDTGAIHRVDTPRWQHFNHRRGVRSERVSGVAARGGVVAASTGDLGLHVSTGSASFVTIDDQSGPADNWVMRTAFDDEGRLWAATCTRGVSVLENGGWRHYTADDGLIDDYTLTVLPIGGTVWVGTLSGLSVIAEDGVKNLDERDGLPGREVHDILPVGGYVFLATDGGLAVLSDEPNDEPPFEGLW